MKHLHIVSKPAKAAECELGAKLEDFITGILIDLGLKEEEVPV